MMSPDQRERALAQMQDASNAFYRSAVFIINACVAAPAAEAAS